MSGPRWQTKFEVKPASWVYVLTPDMDFLGKQIHALVLKHWRIPNNYYHLQPGGHLAALRHHINDHYFAHLDIRNFFGSISNSRITRSLKAFVGYERARKIAKISTVPVSNGQPHSHCLPYGFVQSPVLASVCLQQSHLGTQIASISKSNTIKISLYMDDLLISGTDEGEVKAAFETLKVAAEKSKFHLNIAKESAPATEIVCFNIALSHQCMMITDERLHDFAQDYLATDHPPIQQGIEGYIRTVNPEQLAAFRELLAVPEPQP